MRKYIQIDIDEMKHFRLKIAVARNGTTIKKAVIQMIDEFIEKTSKMGMPYDD